jgi:hypothetical protein
LFDLFDDGAHATGKGLRELLRKLDRRGEGAELAGDGVFVDVVADADA